MPSPPGVMFYAEDWDPILEECDDETIVRFVRYVMTYASTKEVPNLKGFEKSFWNNLQSKIDRDNEKYQLRLTDSAYGGYKRSCKSAGVPPIEKDDWIAAGAPATYSIATATYSSAEASQNVDVNEDVDVNVPVDSKIPPLAAVGARARVDDPFTKVMTYVMRFVDPDPPATIVTGIKHYLDQGLEPDVINHAIDIAHSEHATQWPFIKSILQRYVKDNIKTMIAVRDDEQRFDERKQYQKN